MKYTIETDTDPSAVLLKDIGPTATWFTVSEGLPIGNWYAIDNETVMINRCESGQVRVIRGWADSDVVPHRAGANLYRQQLVGREDTDVDPR